MRLYIADSFPEGLGSKPYRPGQGQILFSFCLHCHPGCAGNACGYLQCSEYRMCACQDHRLLIARAVMPHASSSKASSSSSMLMLPVDGSCNLITISPAHDSLGLSLRHKERLSGDTSYAISHCSNL